MQFGVGVPKSPTDKKTPNVKKSTQMSEKVQPLHKHIFYCLPLYQMGSKK